MSNNIIKEGVHQCSETQKYVYPQEPEVLANLEKFQDMKLGFMTHFGIFSQMSILESWPLVDDCEQGRWSQRLVDWVPDENIANFKREYWNLNKSFNPIRFDPERYAQTIANLGFKYTLIPTKHHDGFCMWDTKYSDYKVTSVNCQFHTNANADIYGRLIEECQKRGLVNGAYFSKPDFRSEYYWTDEFRYETNATRSVAYNIHSEPKRWEQFKRYTEAQLTEIISNYGKIDILWLDGGQVITRNNEDIELSNIVSRLRKINPQLIVVDRIAGGVNENYLTPEVKVLKTYVPVPWESCIPVGRHFSFRYDDVWKTPFELVQIFVEILCKGGNLALNIPTQPDGRLPRGALANVAQFSQWVKAHHEAIFNTRPIAPYYQNKQGLVRSKNGQEYLFIAGAESGSCPKYVFALLKVRFISVKYMGYECELKQFGLATRITLPPIMWGAKTPLYYVFAIKQ